MLYPFSELVTTRHEEHLTWTDSLVKRPKLIEMNIRVLLCLYTAGSLMTSAVV
jgi:hypothetical protein